MKSFSDVDIFLTTPTAARLYREYVAGLPIIEACCYLDVSSIAENRAVSNITELWLYGDQDKWELMRVCGVDERFITGNASDFEKFREFCRIMPMLIGNMQYVACHTELCRYFGCELTINSDNCETIWRETSSKLAKAKLGVYDYVKMSGVNTLLVASSPTDSLKPYEALRSCGELSVIPVFCPDQCFDINKKGIAEYFSKIGSLAFVNICDYDSFCRAYAILMDRFGAAGCRTAYHKMNADYSFMKPDLHHADLILKKALAGKGAEITREEISLWQTQLLRFFGVEYAKRNWVLQSELASCNHSEAEAVLSYLSSQIALPRSLLYSDDSHASEICRKLCRTDQGRSVTLRQGIESADNISELAAKTAIGSVVGFRSKAYGYEIGVIHELWRKELCNVVGTWIDQGICTEGTATETIERICYRNAAQYFEIN